MPSYDDVPYPSYTHPQTHPDRLATIGTLMGMKPVLITQCRVLELGCGDGGNLVPMAFGLPRSEFIGVDLAERPVQTGRGMIADLGLRNVRLESISLMEITPDWGHFDYIIAHGIYSWVQLEVRHKLLQICHENLAPHGIAYVSYNTYPGNHLRNMVREMMLFHVQGTQEPQEKVRQALALARFLAESQSDPDLYRRFLREELEDILDHQEGQLYHDELAPINVSEYFHEFVAHAGQ